jgi:hypothetical protein
MVLAPAVRGTGGVVSRRSWCVLVALLGLSLSSAVAVAQAGEPEPTATAAARCSLSGKERRLGPTYTTALSVTGTSCATGERVVRAWYACRKRNGGAKGRCTSRVLRFSCTETRGEAIPTQFDARVRCRKGSARVNHSYTQYT